MNVQIKAFLDVNIGSFVQKKLKSYKSLAPVLSNFKRNNCIEMSYKCPPSFIFTGIEVVTAVCVRDDDESAVGDQFCEEKRPGDETKECNIQTCPAR